MRHAWVPGLWSNLGIANRQRSAPGNASRARPIVRMIWRGCPHADVPIRSRSQTSERASIWVHRHTRRRLIWSALSIVSGGFHENPWRELPGWGCSRLFAEYLKTWLSDFQAGESLGSEILVSLVTTKSTTSSRVMEAPVAIASGWLRGSCSLRSRRCSMLTACRRS